MTETSCMREGSSVYAAILRDARGQSPRAPQDEGCVCRNAATTTALILKSTRLRARLEGWRHTSSMRETSSMRTRDSAPGFCCARPGYGPSSMSPMEWSSMWPSVEGCAGCAAPTNSVLILRSTRLRGRLEGWRHTSSMRKTSSMRAPATPPAPAADARSSAGCGLWQHRQAGDAAGRATDR